MKRAWLLVQPGAPFRLQVFDADSGAHVLSAGLPASALMLALSGAVQEAEFRLADGRGGRARVLLSRTGGREQENMPLYLIDRASRAQVLEAEFSSEDLMLALAGTLPGETRHCRWTPEAVKPAGRG